MAEDAGIEPRTQLVAETLSPLVNIAVLMERGASETAIAVYYENFYHDLSKLGQGDKIELEDLVPAFKAKAATVHSHLKTYLRYYPTHLTRLVWRLSVVSSSGDVCGRYACFVQHGRHVQSTSKRGWLL